MSQACDKDVFIAHFLIMISLSIRKLFVVIAVRFE